MNPFELFENWYKEELFRTSVSIPSACCLSTIGLDGYPNARFLSLKAMDNESFIITGPTNSRKGQEIEATPKVALTFWWTETKRQVRIQGDVQPIDLKLADFYFKERNLTAQFISHHFNQGEPFDNPSSSFEEFKKGMKKQDAQEIERPPNWGGYRINPVRIEFLKFDESRFHNRQLFLKTENGWQATFLQP